MRQTLSILGLIVLLVALMDVSVAGVLHVAEKHGRLSSLVRYFDYGRSVPGKLAAWEANPEMPGNLYNVGWINEGVAQSVVDFEQEPDDIGPVVRAYGMSFVNRILRSAIDIDPSLPIDLHSGPGAPPNYTFAFLQDDRANRRDGDIAVLGILSSALPAMEAFSNQTFAFEQPAPLTYPIFEADGAELRRIDPIIESAEMHRAMAQNSVLARAWSDQLATRDRVYSIITYGAQWADASPFLRLVRRSLAKGHVENAKQNILEYRLYADVLPLMITSFAQTAREDGQTPVVMLIQSRDRRDPDLLALLGPALTEQGILVLATANHADPANAALFLPDGHYQPEIDRQFAQVFLGLIENLR